MLCDTPCDVQEELPDEGEGTKVSVHVLHALLGLIL